MNMYDVGLNSIPDFSFSQEWPDDFLFPIEDSNSHLSGFGYSVEMLNSSDSGYFRLTDPDTDVTPHRLDSFSISYPPTEHELMSVGPLNEDRPNRAQTEYTTAERTKTSTAKCNRSDKRKVSKAKYARSHGNYLSQARYSASDKGKRTRAVYAATEKCKTMQAIRSARSNGYRRAIKNGSSEEVARKEGELAANKKRVQLSLAPSSCVSVTQPRESSRPCPLYPERNGQKKDDDEWCDLGLCDTIESSNPPLPQEVPASLKSFY